MCEDHREVDYWLKEGTTSYHWPEVVDKVVPGKMSRSTEGIPLMKGEYSRTSPVLISSRAVWLGYMLCWRDTLQTRCFEEC